jgi:TonB family protein
MLRLSLFLSVWVHILILGIASMLISQQAATHESYVEKRFRIDLRKHLAAKTVAPSNRPDETPFKQPEQQFPRLYQDLPLLPPTLQKTDQLKVAQMKPFVPAHSRVLKKPSPNFRSFQPITPKSQEFVVMAREFPTPIPTQKPTSGPAPQPTPVMPFTSSTESNLTSTPSQTPIATTAGEASQDVKKTEINTTGELEPQDGDRRATQQEEALLNQYLQDVAAKINAVKRYPRNARKKGWVGTVVIKLLILPTGEVETVVLTEKSQYEILNEAALQAITKAQPFPRFYQGLTLQSITINVPIQFTLN